MNEENNTKFKILVKEYLEKNSLLLYKEIWSSEYSFNKSKGEKGEYHINSFIQSFSLPTKKSESYQLWKFIYKKDIKLAQDIVVGYIKYPTQDYAKFEYVESIFNLYTNNKKENKILWSIINTKVFLNNYVKIVKDLFDDNYLSHIQKKEIVEYYIKNVEKNTKLNTLENKRVITLLNNSLIKPLEMDLIKQYTLDIQTRTEKCVYFEISVKELMGYSLKLSEKYAEHLLSFFPILLPLVKEAETVDVINRKKETNNIIDIYGYAILTKLDEKLIKKIFTSYIDNYVQILDKEVNFPTQEDILECLRFSVIKSRKENLENNLIIKNTQTKINKI